MESIPRAFHGNFLMADAEGEVALIEVSTQSMHVETRTRDGWLARSNHWVSEEMSYKGRSSGEQSSSQVRLKRATELMGNGEGRIDVAYLSDLYRDHETLAETGWSICAHGHTKSSDGERSGTVSSEIVEPASRTLSYCYGWPCGGPVSYPGEQDYQEYSWGQYLPFSLDELEPGEYVTAEGQAYAPRRAVPGEEREERRLRLGVSLACLFRHGSLPHLNGFLPSSRNEVLQRSPSAGTTERGCVEGFNRGCGRSL